MIKNSEEAKAIGKSTQWVKGQSGNPNGKPKKLPQLDCLLADILSEEKDGIEAAKAILMALRAKATKGDVKAAEMLLDRAYGKTRQNINIDGSMSNLQIIQLPDNNRDKKLDGSD
jgi:hypothetical protein